MRKLVLDHGYVLPLESWGSDARIIEAARMSTDKGFQGWGPLMCAECGGAGRVEVAVEKGWLGAGVGDAATHEGKCTTCAGTGQVPGDEKLLAYLYRNNHATPFEMAGLVVEVQAPIFVFREWHRHRTQSYNELSARYTALPDLFYIPNSDRLRTAKQSATNRQGSADGFGDEDAAKIAECLRTCYANARFNYETLLAVGVAREIARLVIPVAQYSRMRASANLRNWLAFLTLRTAPNAQWEIRQFAEAVGEIVACHFPRTWRLFCDGAPRKG